MQGCKGKQKISPSVSVETSFYCWRGIWGMRNSIFSGVETSF